MQNIYEFRSIYALHLHAHSGFVHFPLWWGDISTFCDLIVRLANAASRSFRGRHIPFYTHTPKTLKSMFGLSVHKSLLFTRYPKWLDIWVTPKFLRHPCNKKHGTNIENVCETLGTVRIRTWKIQNKHTTHFVLNGYNMVINSSKQHENDTCNYLQSFT